MFAQKRLSRRAALVGGSALVGAAVGAAAVARALPTGSPTAAAQSGTLTIAVLPTNTPEQLSADARDIEQFLSSQMNRRVDLVFPTSYAGVVESLRFGHAQAAFMSAWPLALAKRIANAETVLAEVREVYIGDERTEAPFYFSYFIVMPDSPYQRLEELQGKRVAFPSQLSTSGYVAPLARLVELGLVQREGNREADPRSFFGQVLFAGGYGQAWEALRNGQVDVTVTAGDVSASLYNEVIANTRQIEQQGPVPSHGVAFARQLTGPTRDRLKEALLALGAPENRELMRKFISGIFVRFQETTTEQHIGNLTRYLELTGLGFTETLR